MVFAMFLFKQSSVHGHSRNLYKFLYFKDLGGFGYSGVSIIAGLLKTRNMLEHESISEIWVTYVLTRLTLIFNTSSRDLPSNKYGIAPACYSKRNVNFDSEYNANVSITYFWSSSNLTFTHFCQPPTQAHTCHAVKPSQ